MRLRFAGPATCSSRLRPAEPDLQAGAPDTYAVTMASAASRFSPSSEAGPRQRGWLHGRRRRHGTPVWSNIRQVGAFAGYIAVWNTHIEQPCPITTGMDHAARRPRHLHARWPSHLLVRPTLPHDARPINGSRSRWTCITTDVRRIRRPGGRHVKLWIADEGQPFDLVVDKASAALHRQPEPENRQGVDDALQHRQRPLRSSSRGIRLV